MAELRATPQSPALGRIAAALRKAQEFAGQYQVLPQVPLLGGTGVDELLGLPGAAREVENWSYGNYPVRINPNAGRTASFIPEVKPGRKSDLADTMLLGLDVAPLARIAGKGVVRAARSAPAQAIDRMVREGYESGMIPAPGMTIKPKGGNWLAGHTDYALQPVRRGNQPVLSGEVVNEAAGRDLFSEYRKAYDQDPTIGLHEWTRKNYPEVYAQIQGPEAAAADRFINTKLDKYIRNEMGTPEDPVRALAERGVLHVDPTDLNYRLEAYGKYPQPGQEFMATSDAAKMWEGASDNAINVAQAGDYLKFMGDSEYAKTIEKNPWLKKVPPETKVYGTAEAETLASDLGFEHLIDELKFSMDPNSGLPANLRFDPKDIDKITVPQAVERVSKINAWRAEEAARAEKAGMLENLQATPRMADDSFQLSFVDKPGGAWVDIPETVDDKGMKLCNSIGKAGGWCTQAEWAAKSYGSGENRLTALVDAEGRPHAQAKITENDWPVSGEGFTRLDPQTKAQYGQYVREWRQRNPEIEELTDEDVIQALKEAGVQGPAPDITELKPVGNSFSSERAQEYAKRDPDYFRKVENSVLKFLNSGEWGRVKDLHHYGIVDLKEPNSLMDAMKVLYGDESNRRIGQEFIDAFNHAVSVEPNAPRFMTQRQLREFIGPVEPLEGYAGGGVVKGAVKSIGELVDQYVRRVRKMEELGPAGYSVHKVEAPASSEVPGWHISQDLPGILSTGAMTNKAVGANNIQGWVPAHVGGAYFYSDPRLARAKWEDLADVVGDPKLAAEMPVIRAQLRRGNRLVPDEDVSLSVPWQQSYQEGSFATKRPVLINQIDRIYSADPSVTKDMIRDTIIRQRRYAAGGAVNYDPAEIEELARSIVPGYAAGGLVRYDPNEIDTIVSQLKEEFHG